MTSSEMEKKINLFEEKSYNIFAEVHDYAGEQDKALSFKFSYHISKLSADLFLYFFHVVRNLALKDNFLETGKNEPEMISEVLFQNFSKENLDNQESLENAIRECIKDLRKYEFLDPNGSLEKISFIDLMKIIEIKLKALREEEISFWERLFKVYKKNKKEYDAKFIKKYERRLSLRVND